MADCKRKTANLFDGNYTVAVMSVSGDTATLNTASSGRTAIVECEPNTTYTVRKYGVSNRFIIAESDIKPVNGTAMSIIQNDSSKSEYIFTTSNTTQYVAIYCSTSSEQAEPQLMLNIGSTALPYEPYGWVHSLRKLSTDTDTITTLPAVLYTTGTTATVGLKGQMVQSSTPSPSSPVMPEGCGERTENLAQWEKGGINTSTGANEAYRTKEQGGTCEQLRTQYIPCVGDHDYVLSVNKYPVQTFISFYDENKNYLSRTSGSPQGKTRTFRTSIDAKYMRAQLAHVLENQAYPAIEENAQFEITLGSTIHPYEPYGYKLDISSGDTITPVYLGEVESTRQIKKFVLTGREGGVWSPNVTIPNGNAFYNANIFTNYKQNMGVGYCTHYPLATTITATIGVYFGGNINFITDFSEGIDTRDKWITYLQQQYDAGTPVTVWYVLAEPETAVVNEPLMKIGDYADEVANVSIPVTAGGDTISVDTTVQPSEVTVNYEGWHPVQSVREKSKNILPSPQAATKSNNGITVRSDGAGRYYVSGTAENDAYITFNIPPFLIPISVGLNGNGTFSMFNTKTYQNAAVKLEFYYQGTLVDNWGLINLNRTSTNYSAMANRTTDTVGIFVKSGSTVDFQISPEFTNDGVLPTNYEPYWK